ALRQAEAACRLIPDDGYSLTALGIAEYRVGKYREAVATLERADRLKKDLRQSPDPRDLAFLALAHHHLGQADPARAALSRLRELRKDPERARVEYWQALLATAPAARAVAKEPERARDEYWQGFLREAEALELDLVFPADPFAR